MDADAYCHQRILFIRVTRGWASSGSIAHEIASLIVSSKEEGRRSRLFPVADEIEEGPVNSRVLRELGMEGRGHDSSLPDRYRVVAFRSDDFDSRPDALDLWCADENHFQGRIFCRQRWQLVVAHFVLKKFAFADGAVDLASVGVAAD